AMGITQALTINTTETDKGYTGQESLDSVSLVDYNARLYDPALGRFLSVDPMIGHPGSTQSINPYSYVENNPLNKIDPTGEETTCSQNGSSGSTCGGGNAEASMCSNSAYCESATSVKLSNGQGISEGAPGQQIDSQKQQQSQSNSGTTGTKSSNADNDTENGTHGDIGTNDRGNEGDSSNGNDPTGSTMPAVPSVPTFDSSLSNVGLTFDSGYVPLSYKPLGGNETVGEIAGIVNGETSVMRDSSAENESLFNARVKITHVRLNGIAKWGDKVGVLAGMAHPLMHGPEYWPSVSAVQKAVQEERNFIDPTFGAYFYNERTLKQAAGMADFQNASIHTFSGPYLSTTPNKYIFTYGDP
ncbi:MAG: RHS repeat-associated core domain-containing protein, partial [Candidatus Micrarchaeaceae archaeon]